jgi:FAD synthase
VVPPFDMDGRAVRSTEVRAEIAAGDLDGAARLLGRPHTVVGDAVAAGRGSVLRFPLPVALPPDGTYRVRVDDATRPKADQPAAGDTLAIVGNGAVSLPGVPGRGPLRVAFLSREQVRRPAPRVGSREGM